MSTSEGGNWWPQSVAWARDEDEVEEQARRLWDKHQRAWSERRNLYQLYVDHFPDVLEKLRECRQRVTVRPGLGKDGRTIYMVKREPCRRRPFCPACNEEKRTERAGSAANLIERCTPGKAKPMARAITFAARRHTENPLWQAAAMKDHRAFMRAIAEGFDKAYGGGTGMLVTFQPYGANVFTEDHPHAHVIVNWHALSAELGARRLQDLDFTSSNDAKNRALKPVYDAMARELNVDMHHMGTDMTASHTFIDPQIAVGRAAIKLRYRYNYRELINPLDWTYYSKTQKVRLYNYRTPEASRTIDARSLRPRIAAYGARWGDWTDYASEKHGSTRPIDGWYGHLAYGEARKNAEAAFAHQATHRDDCSCGECTEYARPEYRPELQEEPVDPIGRPFT